MSILNPEWTVRARVLLVPFSVALVLAVPLGRSLAAHTARAALAQAQAPAPVDITLQCDGLISLQPALLRVKQGQPVEWILAATSTVDTFWVEPKNPGRWMYAQGKVGGKKGLPARSGAMKPDQKGVRAGYTVKGRCPQNREITIDPDIIVD